MSVQAKIASGLVFCAVLAGAAAATPPPQNVRLVAAVLPTSRSVQVNDTATVFATVINATTEAGTGCVISKPSDLAADFAFYRTNPASNAITSAANAPQDIAPGEAATFLLTVSPTAPLQPREVEFRFECLNAPPAPVFAGVNTLLLSAATSPVPDVIALASTLTNDGVMQFDTTYGTSAFAVAAINVGAAGSIRAEVPNTAIRSRQSPPRLTLCRTNPATGVCLNGPTPATSPSETVTLGAGETATFAVFGTGRGTIAFDPAFSRAPVRFVATSDGNQRGATSVAVRTNPTDIRNADFRDEAIYFLLTDRFANGDTTNDGLPGSRTADPTDTSNPLGWHGGDFRGVQQKITEGYFQSMGFTALWITPVVLQVPPPGTGGGPNASRPTTGYHGYWAESFLAIEPHLGTLADLQALVATARANGIKVVIDVVVNHAGYGSTLVRDNPSWFRTGSACGNDDTTSCLAGLPDFITTTPAVREYLFSTIQWLRDNVNPDGLRMDTMKHVDDAFWQAFFAPGAVADPASIWTVGEVFDSNVTRLARFMDTLGSPSVFDFALRDGLLNSIAKGEGASGLASLFAQDSAYSDPTKLATFFDNHDVRRFVSEAVQSGKTRADALQRLELALGVLYTVRGIPTVYYGTEVGMEGLGDPYNLANGQHNRETMTFGALANTTLDERIGALGAARLAYPALRRGTQRTLIPNADSGCGVADAGRDNSAAFGAMMNIRGTFNSWAAGDRFINLDGSTYAAEVAIPAGAQQYKIADAGWTIEYGVTGGTTQLGQTYALTRLSGGAANASLSLAQGGCYRWEINATTPSAPTVRVTRKGDASELFAFVREMPGQLPVVVVVNNSATALDLASLPGGGVPVTGLLANGASLVEVSGQALSGFSVSGGRLVGTVPARAMRAVATAEAGLGG